MWVGWVTSDFHQCDMAFDSDNVHTVTVTLGDDSGKVQERLVCSGSHVIGYELFSFKC